MIFCERMIIWRNRSNELSSFQTSKKVRALCALRKSLKFALYDEFTTVDQHELTRSGDFVVAFYLLHG